MDQWTPDEVEAHVQFMRHFASRAHNAPNLAERDHQICQAARLNQMLRHHQ